MSKIYKYQSLIGNNYGRLTVISEGARQGSDRYWLCQCICGNSKYIIGKNLRDGKTKSCGCLQRESVSNREFDNLDGKSFGRWLVLDQWKIEENKGRVWLCKCTCGTVRFVQASLLKSGDSKSCGCLNRDHVSEAVKLNLIGKKFGRWTVLEEAGRTPTSSVLWLCRCECGTEKVVSGNSLRNGRSKSCGCYKLDRITKHGKSNTIEYKVMQSRKHREIRKQLDIEWNFKMDEALRKLQPTCIICGIGEKEHLEKYKQRLHVDHVLPLSKGYGLKPGNAVVLCHYHNISKINKSLSELPLEWQAKIIWNAFRFKDHWQQLQENIYE